MMLRVVAAVCLLVSAEAGAAFAQSRPINRPPPEPAFRRDDDIAKAVAEKTAGAVAFDVDVKPGNCEQTDTTLARMANGQVAHFVTVTNSRRFNLVQSFPVSQGGMSSMVPGDYVVFSIFCKYGNHRNTLNGPFAAFQVRPGEVTNLGVLRVELVVDRFGILWSEVKGMKKSIGAMTPEVRAKMKEEFPRAFPLAVERRMTMIGPPEVAAKKR